MTKKFLIYSLLTIISSFSTSLRAEAGAADTQHEPAPAQFETARDPAKLETPFWAYAHTTVEGIQADLLQKARGTPPPEHGRPSLSIADQDNSSGKQLPEELNDVVKTAQQLRALGAAASLDDVRQAAGFIVLRYEPAVIGEGEEAIERTIERRAAAREVASRFAADLLNKSDQRHPRRKQDLLLLANLSFRLNRDENAYLSLLSAAANVDEDVDIIRALEVMSPGRHRDILQVSAISVLESIAQPAGEP